MFLPTKLSVFSKHLSHITEGLLLLPAVGYFWLAEIEVFNLLPLGTFQLRLSHGIKTDTLFRTNKKNNSLIPENNLGSPRMPTLFPPR